MWNVTKEKVKEEEGIEITPGCRTLALTNHSYWLKQSMVVKHNMLIIFILLSCLNNDLATVGCPDKKERNSVLMGKGKQKKCHWGDWYDSSKTSQCQTKWSAFLKLHI